jgi:hypothetical protein
MAGADICCGVKVYEQLDYKQGGYAKARASSEALIRKLDLFGSDKSGLLRII